MELLPSVTSKGTTSKKRKTTKNQLCQHSVQTALTNNHSLQKTPSTSHKQPTSSRPSKTQKPRSSSTKPTHSNNKCLSGKVKSPTRKGSFTKKEVKGKKNYSDNKARDRVESMNLLGEGSKSAYPQGESMYPLSQQPEMVEYKSYLIASNGEKMEYQHDDCPSYLEEAMPNLLVDSGMVRVPDRIQKLYDQSLAIKSGAMSRREWQQFQTLKIKNEELTTYIEQLQKINEEEEKKRKTIQTAYQQQQIQLKTQINDLKEEQSRLNEANATLQQLFNQGKQNLASVTQKYQELSKRTQKSPSRQSSPSVEAVQRRIFELQQEVHASRRNISALTQQKLEISNKLAVVQQEKMLIKKQAEEMIHLLQLIREES